MNILFLSHKFFPDIGGIEVNSEVLATNFYKIGHEVHLLTWTEQKDDKAFPFTVIRKPDVLTLLREHKWADVVFENNPCLKLSWYNLFFRKPNVVALRTWLSRTDGHLSWKDHVKHWWLKNSSNVIAVSNAVRTHSWASAVVIGNPYRSDLFKKKSLEVAAPYSFVYLGRLVSDKGVAIAVKAFSEYVRTVKRTRNKNIIKPILTIIGDGPERSKIEKMVNESSIAEYVFFKGMLQGVELVSCLTEHRYLLVPSLWEEPFGNVVLEGMACGCLPIVSYGGGLPEAIGNAGLIFKRGDSESLLEIMKFITSNPECELEIRNATAAHLIAHEPEVIAKKYLEVIYEAMAK